MAILSLVQGSEVAVRVVRGADLDGVEEGGFALGRVGRVGREGFVSPCQPFCSLQVLRDEGDEAFHRLDRFAVEAPGGVGLAQVPVVVPRPWLKGNGVVEVRLRLLALPEVDVQAAKV